MPLGKHGWIDDRNFARHPKLPGNPSHTEHICILNERQHGEQKFWMGTDKCICACEIVPEGHKCT